jgi:hypothetical protein
MVLGKKENLYASIRHGRLMNVCSVEYLVAFDGRSKASVGMAASP